jgi:hypothetical protein
VTEHRKYTLIACLTAGAVAIGLLFRPISQMNLGLWGPADPWNNGDFIGAHWLFWAASQTGDPTQWLHWPWGEVDVLQSFPNPFDAWLIGPWISEVPTVLWWNIMMLSHHLLNIAATVVLARSVGARPLHAAMAGALVASTPLMLHELTLGHTLTSAVWPGLFALSASANSRDKTAGVWLGIQGLAYLYTGLFFGLVACLIRPRRGLLLAMVLMVPYLAVLAPQMESTVSVLPPDGFTALPLDALWGGSRQLQVRLQPLLWIGLLAIVMGGARKVHSQPRMLVSALVLIFLALGTQFVLHRGEGALAGSPTAWLLSVPGLSRMHHPIRLGIIATPLLAVSAALALNQRRAIWPLVILLGTALSWRTIDNTAAWPGAAEPPGAQAAEWLAKHGTAIVDLGSDSMQALALQTIHHKPILSGFHPRARPRPGVDPIVFQQVDAWSKGHPQPSLPAHLKQLGFSHVLVVDRGVNRPIDPSAVQSQLGAPVFPGVYAL